MVYKAAFVSSDGENVDRHFGRAEQFYIYLIDEEEKKSQIAITSWTPSTRQSSCRFGQVHLQRLHPGFGIPEFFSEDSYTRSRYLRFVGL